MTNKEDWERQGKEQWSCKGYAITANSKPAGIRYTAWCPGVRVNELVVIGYYWNSEDARQACYQHHLSA